MRYSHVWLICDKRAEIKYIKATLCVVLFFLTITTMREIRRKTEENPLTLPVARGEGKAPVSIELLKDWSDWLTGELSRMTAQQEYSSTTVHPEWCDLKTAASYFGMKRDRMRTYVCEGVRLGRIRKMQPKDYLGRQGFTRYNMSDLEKYLCECS